MSPPRDSDSCFQTDVVVPRMTWNRRHRWWDCNQPTSLWSESARPSTFMWGAFWSQMRPRGVYVCHKLQLICKNAFVCVCVCVCVTEEDGCKLESPDWRREGPLLIDTYKVENFLFWPLDSFIARNAFCLLRAVEIFLEEWSGCCQTTDKTNSVCVCIRPWFLGVSVCLLRVPLFLWHPSCV